MAMGLCWAAGSWEDSTWATGSWEGLVLTGDSINDRLKQYLESAYIPSVYASADFMTLLQYDLAQRTGTYTARFNALIADAS